MHHSGKMLAHLHRVLVVRNNNCLV
jgi:hypothetical protein